MSDTPNSQVAQEAPQQEAMNPAECSARLKALFPALFGADKPLPLKLRIQADIQERAPGVFTKAVLSAFLRRYTGSYGYLIGLTKATQRFDLDGNPAGDITDEHRQAAQDELKRRRTIKEAKQAEEGQARRERVQVLRDFERTTLTVANFCALKGIDPAALDGLLAQARQDLVDHPEIQERRPSDRRGQGRPNDRAERNDRGPRRDARPGDRSGERRPGRPQHAKGSGAPRSGPKTA